MPPCPICGRPSAPRAQNAAAPFCSVRCKQVDLGAWLDERYRVPVNDPEALEEALADAPKESH
jgi:endogenous inhibitor of DNA gyrase (YacG/DUF329 family)